MRYLWAISLILTSLMSTYCAKLSNEGVKYGSLYVFICGILNVLTWLWVTKVSKNLLFDTVVFDGIMVITFALGFMMLKCGTSEFEIRNWIGLIMALIGVILMRV